MLAKLKMLMSIQAWMKSRTLNLAGILGILSGMDVAAGTGMIETVIDLIMKVGFSQGTAVAALVFVKSLADVILRAKTDRALDQK